MSPGYRTPSFEQLGRPWYHLQSWRPEKRSFTSEKVEVAVAPAGLVENAFLHNAPAGLGGEWRIFVRMNIAAAPDSSVRRQ